MNRITINGNEYPCYQTMGAMRRFRRLTGREITEVQVTEASAMADYMYCCCAAASAAEHIEFNYSIDDFADLITLDVMKAWSQSIATEATEDEDAAAQKKS